MVNIKLGDKVYDGVTAVKLDTAEGGEVTFAPYEEALAAGRQAEYDWFWDAFQQNGNKNDYTYGFCRWDRTTFLPKYDIRGRFNTTFHSFNRDDPNWETFDMAQHLEDLGVVLDMSASGNMMSLFMWAWIGRIGVIDCTGIEPGNGLQNAFGYGKIRTIDKLIVTPNVLFTNAFIENPELTNITFEGIIGNAISFQWQNKLSDASVQSVIDHLQDLTGADSKTVTFHGTVGAKLTEEQKAVITAKNWTLVY